MTDDSRGSGGRRRRSRDARLSSEALYVCTACGEEIVIPVDPSAGASQRFVEDCPVCCHPNVITVEIDDDGDVRAWGEPE